MKNKHALRFRWGYVKKYGWYQKFAFGWMFGPLFIYQKKALVFSQTWVYRDAILDSVFDIVEMIREKLNDDLWSQIPYDFGFFSLVTHQDYEIDYDRYRMTIEGHPVPIPVPEENS